MMTKRRMMTKGDEVETESMLTMRMKEVILKTKTKTHSHATLLAVDRSIFQKMDYSLPMMIETMMCKEITMKVKSVDDVDDSRQVSEVSYDC
jgi:short subunit fatty acids transporter